MLRMLSIVAAFMTLGAAFALYSLKYDTRRVEIAVQGKERALEKLEADIAILKAERAYLARPDRIEKMARKQGLGPIREQQYLSRSARPSQTRCAGAARISRSGSGAVRGEARPRAGMAGATR